MNIETPEQALRQIFGLSEFRKNQKDIIDAVSNNQDGLAVMATGSGKSILYQIPAITSPGTTIVVSPLISLMKDQVDSLKKKGIDAESIYSEKSINEKNLVMNKMINNEVDLIYVSPEKLQDEDFQEVLARTDIDRFAIDEAHCVSMWGHSFRKSYTKINNVLNKLEKAKGVRLARFGFTATANERTSADIAKELELKEDHFQHVGSFKRPNITFEVKQTKSKMSDAVDFISRHQREQTIVYCATVKSVERLTQHLKSLGINSLPYHGRMDKETREQNQNSFMQGETHVMIATNAFGMGVNPEKDNAVRNILHYDMPQNVENYYQEAGRAGRDGKPSKALILYGKNDRKLQQFFIDGNFPKREIIESVKSVIAALDDGDVFTIRKNKINELSRHEIKPFQVDNAVSIIEDQGLITTHENESGEYFSIETNGIEKELELDFIPERREIALTKLNAMAHYCVTSNCRESFMLSALGDPDSHNDCGQCDNCIHESERNKDITNKENKEILLKSAIFISKTQCSYEVAKLALTGTSNMLTRKNGLDKIEGFGLLKNETKDAADNIINTLIKESIIMKESNKNLSITKRGRDFINNEENRDNLFGNNTKKDKIIDRNIYRSISTWRKNTSIKKGVAEHMIMSDKVIQDISKEERLTKEKLKEIGLPEKKIEKIGDELIKEHEKGIKNKKQELEM